MYIFIVHIVAYANKHACMHTLCIGLRYITLRYITLHYITCETRHPEPAQPILGVFSASGYSCMWKGNQIDLPKLAA